MRLRLGVRLGPDKQKEHARRLVEGPRDVSASKLASAPPYYTS